MALSGIYQLDGSQLIRVGQEVTNPVQGTLYMTGIQASSDIASATKLSAPSVENDGGTSVLWADASFGGDVSGTYNNLAVSDDSHNHGNSTLTGVPGSGIDTSVNNLLGVTIQPSAPTARDHYIYTGSQWEHETHYWNHVLSGTGTGTSLTLTSSYIAGNTQDMIKIYLWGYWYCYGSDRYMYLRFNNDTGSNYGSYTHYHGYESGIGEHHSSSTYAYGGPGSSSRFGWNAWGRDCDVTCEITIYPEVHQTRIRQVHSRFMWVDNDGSDITALNESTMINWTNTSNELTNIDLIFNGGGLAQFYYAYKVVSFTRK